MKAIKTLKTTGDNENLVLGNKTGQILLPPICEHNGDLGVHLQQSFSHGEGKSAPDFGFEPLSMQKRQITTTPWEQVKKEFVDYKTLEKVRVICRFRPSNKHEQREEKQMGMEQSNPEIDGEALSLTRRLPKGVNSSIESKKTFHFDKVIDWKSSQNRCFRVIGFPMVEAVLAGYNATIFAYGQTGSGKTYTMFGPEGMHTPRHVGLIHRSMAMLFKRLKERKERQNANHHRDRFEGFTVRIQFLQIYKEKLYDLLNPINGADLRLRHDPRTKAPYVENITMNVVHETKEVLRLIKIAISNRITDKTDMNDVSSRSHLVMTVTLEQNKSNGTKVTSKLNFGDLSGSESVRRSGAKLGSKQFEELKFINKSLSQLTTVINSVVNNRRADFRSSKLTYLLQDSIGGNTKTSVVVCCSPHITNRDETIRALTFAKNAKSVKNRAKVNKEYTLSHTEKIISDLTSENNQLKYTISSLESKLKLAEVSGNVEKSDEYKNLMARVSELENQMSTQRAKDSKIIQELKDQLRLKDMDLDASHLQVQKLQDEEQRKSDGRQNLMDEIEQLREEFQRMRKQFDELSMEKLKLDEQLREKSMVIKQERERILKLENRIKFLDEDVVSKNLKIQDLDSQNFLLTKDVQKAASAITAEEILKKHHLDEAILCSLKFDLSQVLLTWRNRHKQIDTVLPIENSTIALEARSVIKFFELAMTQLEDHENTQNDRNNLLTQIQEHATEIRILKRTIVSLRSLVSGLKAENEALHQSNESALESKNKDSFKTTNLDDELLNYLNKKALEIDYESDEETKEVEETLFGNDMSTRRGIDWRNAIKKGDSIDALDPTDLWFTASVLDVKNEGDGDQLLIHYEGFDNRYDEWIPRFSRRLSEAWSRATGGKESGGVYYDRYKIIGERNGEGILKEGWMEKKSSGMLKAWFRSRYFVLFQNGMLKYYANEREQVAKGYINLSLVKKIEMDKADYRRGIFEFSLKGSGPACFLRVKSQEYMNAWIASLKAVRLKVIDNNSAEWLECNRPNNHLNLDVRRKSRRSLLDFEGISSISTPRISLKEVIGLKAIHQGNLWKMGGNIRSWNKRFFELLPDKTIVYYEDSQNGCRPATNPRGRVDIWGVLGIKQLNPKDVESVHLPEQCAAGMKLETTNTGVIIVGMEAVEDLEKWKNAIAENCVFASNSLHESLSPGSWTKKIGDYFSPKQSSLRSMREFSSPSDSPSTRTKSYSTPARSNRPVGEISVDMVSENQNISSLDEDDSPCIKDVDSWRKDSSRQSLMTLRRKNNGKLPLDLLDIDDRKDSCGPEPVLSVD